MFRFKVINDSAIAFICAPILLLLFYPRFSLAELVRFQRAYTYQASEADSKLSSRSISLEQVSQVRPWRLRPVACTKDEDYTRRVGFRRLL